MQRVKNNISSQNSSGKQVREVQGQELEPPASLGLQVSCKYSCHSMLPQSKREHIKQTLLHCGSISFKQYPKINVLLQKRFTNVCTNYPFNWVKKALELLKDLLGSVLCSLSRVCPVLAVQDCKQAPEPRPSSHLILLEVESFDTKWDLSKHNRFHRGSSDTCIPCLSHKGQSKQHDQDSWSYPMTDPVCPQENSTCLYYYLNTSIP